MLAEKQAHIAKQQATIDALVEALTDIVGYWHGSLMSADDAVEIIIDRAERALEAK